MTDNAADLVLILLKELSSARERDLVDISVNFLGSHTDTVVNDLECFLLLVELDVHRWLSKLSVELSVCSKSLQLLDCIHSICHKLSEEDLMV